MYSFTVSFVTNAPETMSVKDAGTKIAHLVRNTLTDAMIPYCQLTVTPRIPYPQLQVFYAIHQQLNLITSFTAENIYHAGNKAIKHWGDDVFVYKNLQVENGNGHLKVPQAKFTKMLRAWYGQERDITEPSAG